MDPSTLVNVRLTIFMLTPYLKEFRMTVVDLAHKIESIIARRAPSRFSMATHALDKAFVLFQERCGIHGGIKHADLDGFSETLSLHYGKGRNLRGLGLEGKLETFLDREIETRPWILPSVRSVLISERSTIASLAAAKHRAIYARARR